MPRNLLKGKTVLIVDDERDVLETLEDLLSMCEVVKASTFEEAKLASGNPGFRHSGSGYHGRGWIQAPRYCTKQKSGPCDAHRSRSES